MLSRGALKRLTELEFRCVFRALVDQWALYDNPGHEPESLMEEIASVSSLEQSLADAYPKTRGL